MKSSAKAHILKFLQENKGEFHNAELQRMDFKNRNGSNATGDTIKRRLQELAEEGKIYVNRRNGEAWYSAEYVPPAPKYEYREKQNENGDWVVQKVLV